MREPHASDHAPRDWSEAFAALPPETPPADALSGVFAQLPAPASRRRLRLPLTLAASLLALACVPLMWRALPHASSTNAVASTSRATATVPTPKPAVNAVTDTPPETIVEASTRPAVTTQPEPSRPTRIAKADRSHRKLHRARKPSPATDPADSTMEPLYAESARLEALLALARDDRAASATAVALGSDFEARVASIDASLAQPALTKRRRQELWRDRVSALRAYASFESTQRALAASGERYDAMLVSID